MTRRPAPPAPPAGAPGHGAAPRRVAALVLAGGKGLRAGGGLAKQWRDLAGRPVLAHAIGAFAAHPGIAEVLTVAPAGDLARARALGVEAVAGGDSRAASVRAGLAALRGRGFSHVLIHDGARPLVPAQGWRPGRAGSSLCRGRCPESPRPGWRPEWRASPRIF